MQTCIKCGGKGDFRFRALTVRTVYLREMKGERRVQGLGDFTEMAVCRACAGQRLHAASKPGKELASRLLPFAAIMLIGAALSILFTFGGGFLTSVGLGEWANDGVLRLFGLAALLCGALGLIGNLRAFADTRSEYAALSGDEALEHAAWAVASEGAPQKSGDEELTYIPVTAHTMAMKNGDLMIAYRLLPEIAREAHGLLHAPNSSINARAFSLHHV